MDLGYVTEEAVMECAAVRDHLQVTDLDSYKIDLKAADMVSPGFAGHNRIIPIDFEESRLVVAASIPLTWMSLTRPQPLPAWRSRWSLGHPRQWDGPLTGRMKIPQAVIMDHEPRVGTSGAGITDNRNRQMELVLKERWKARPCAHGQRHH